MTIRRINKINGILRNIFSPFFLNFFDKKEGIKKDKVYRREPVVVVITEKASEGKLGNEFIDLRHPLCWTLLILAGMVEIDNYKKIIVRPKL